MRDLKSVSCEGQGFDYEIHSLGLSTNIKPIKYRLYRSLYTQSFIICGKKYNV